MTGKNRNNGLIKRENSDLKKSEFNIRIIDFVLSNSISDAAKFDKYKNILGRFNEVDSHFLIRQLSSYHNFSDSFLNTVNKVFPIEKMHVSWDVGLSELRIIKNLFSNPNFAWAEENLTKYEDSLNWSDLSSNQYINWTEKSLEKYSNKLIWGEYNGGFPHIMPRRGLSSNLRFNWDSVFLNKHKSEIDWKLLSNNVSVLWSKEILREFEDYLDWKELSANKSIPWTKELIVTFLNKWHRTYLFKQEEIPWDEELIHSFSPTNKEWKLLSAFSNIPESSNLFDKYINYWNWHSLSSNPNVIWTVVLLKNKASILNWGKKSAFASKVSGGLSANPSLPWSTELIDSFFNHWEWSSISGNCGIHWSLELIRRYQDHLDWEVLSKNSSIPWSIELIQKFENKWDWNELVKNQSLPWSEELLSYLFERNEKTWLYSLSLNQGLYNHINSIFTEDKLETIYKSILDSNRK